MKYLTYMGAFNMQLGDDILYLLSNMEQDRKTPISLAEIFINENFSISQLIRVAFRYNSCLKIQKITGSIIASRLYLIKNYRPDTFSSFVAFLRFEEKHGMGYQRVIDVCATLLAEEWHVPTGVDILNIIRAVDAWARIPMATYPDATCSKCLDFYVKSFGMGGEKKVRSELIELFE